MNLKKICTTIVYIKKKRNKQQQLKEPKSQLITNQPNYTPSTLDNKQQSKQVFNTNYELIFFH